MKDSSFHLVLLTQELSRPALMRKAFEALSPEIQERLRLTAANTLDLAEDPEKLARAVASADLLVISHILSEEEIGRVEHLVEHALSPGAHLLVMNSLRPLLMKTRLGSLSLGAVVQGMNRAPSGPGAKFAALFRRLATEDDLTEVIRDFRRALPSLLQALPAPLRGLEVYIRACLYWNEPSPENLRSLMLMAAHRLGSGFEDFADHVAEPEIFEATGLYHPEVGIAKELKELPERAAEGGTVGLLLTRGHVLSGDTSAIDEIVRVFESRSLRVIPAFSDSFDFREAIETYFDVAGVDAVVSGTGFPLVGGHNRCESEQTRDFLNFRGILYLASPCLMIQDVASWERSGLGLLPMEVAMEVAIHEIEGGIEPIVLQGVESGEGESRRIALTDRAERLADRLRGWLSLRHKENRDKRVLVTLFSFPPGKGSVGTAAYLDVMASAYHLLQRLEREGYDLEVPSSPQELLERIVVGEETTAPIHATDLAVGARVKVRDYEEWSAATDRVTKLWGPAPGKLNTDGRDLIVHGVSLGNVFVGVQPSFGYEGDPMRLLFDRGATPHHGFLAYYLWAEREFRADAMIHLGTHGALEFMPGKQAGLSAECWPDILAGSIPNLYLYSVNNPSEGTIAKRRGTAVTISHLSPPVEVSGLYRELSTLKNLIADLHRCEDWEGREKIGQVLIELCRKVHLDAEISLPASLDPATLEEFVGILYVRLTEIEARRIPVGLHTIGAAVPGEECKELLASIGEHARREEGLRSFAHLVLESEGADPSDVETRARDGEESAVRRLARIHARWRELIEIFLQNGTESVLRGVKHVWPQIEIDALERLLTALGAVRDRLDHCDELTPLTVALSGRYLEPGPGGDPVRNPAVIPTGRNLHALDPGSVPSPSAFRQAEALVEILLRRCVTTRGSYPRSLGMVLWGLDNIKTQGEAIAQAFLLLGVRVLPNSIGRMTEIEVISLEELGRPRIDVVISASGIFRDVFGLQMALLDEAVRVVADLEEPESMNFVRARRNQLVDEEGFSAREAATRVFCNAPGAYGANVDYMVGLSTWDERKDLADVYLRRKGFAFGRNLHGEGAKEVLAALAKGIDTTYQNLDSSEVSLTDVDHYFEYLGGLTALTEARSGTRPDVLVADTTSARATVRTLEETVRLEVRTKLLNPRWTEGMLKHGYQGVEEIRKRFDYTFGWSATCEAVDGWIYREVHRTYIENEEVRGRMQEKNLHSFTSLVRRLLEADSRGFWEPTADERDRLEELSEEVEDLIEGVV